MDVRVGLWRKLSMKNCCFWTVVLEKTLENPLDCHEIQPVHPTWNQSWVFFGRTDTEAEIPIFWPLDAKNWLTGKGPDARKDGGGRRRGQQRMRWLDGITDVMDMSLSKLGDGQGSLVSCNPWGHRVGDDWAIEPNWTLLYGFPLAYIINLLYSSSIEFLTIIIET